MKVLNTFDTSADFWTLNPQLKIPEIFNTLYTKDKSKGKSESSMVMWAIALYLDTDSKFANLPDKDRQDLIINDYLKDKKFKFQNYKDEMELYSKLCLTQAQRSLNMWNKKMREREEFMGSTPYTLGTKSTKGYFGGTASILDGMMGNTKKLYDDYQRVIKELEKDQMEEIGLSNRESSLSDKGEI